MKDIDHQGGWVIRPTFDSLVPRLWLLNEGGDYLGEHLRRDHEVRRNRDWGDQRGQEHRDEEANRYQAAGHQRRAS